MHSISGRQVTGYLDPQQDLFKKCSKVILFNSGAEFFVCKTMQKEHVLHVYLREVNVGFSDQVIVWVDD